MGSADQDNTDVLQQGERSLTRIRGANLTETVRLTLRTRAHGMIRICPSSDKKTHARSTAVTTQGWK
ncbi:hypothetical protein ALO83_103485 [Pseudomonas cannabina pv. alisalensis]|uniref:Uncharacterized protein n=1 Tax=Pseudomonas cannabina TaxID=86840 RepID=A0A3M3PS90_PSECA|nr:Uncharacterized protein AC507_0582 [Pseudomonas syringae pv. maculicola]KPW16949.1 hypothetical protein ALO83_103485 [Pseudomonas cannabina pv. alisalensis]RMN74850.1 hypothetical protein ALQ53_103263 [Pseudomonas cannabina]RMO01233.1 hypothetical protein ALQ51_101998 [Pseudomonas cannabina]